MAEFGICAFCYFVVAHWSVEARRSACNSSWPAESYSEAVTGGQSTWWNRYSAQAYVSQLCSINKQEEPVLVVRQCDFVQILLLSFPLNAKDFKTADVYFFSLLKNWCKKISQNVLIFLKLLLFIFWMFDWYQCYGRSCDSFFIFCVPPSISNLSHCQMWELYSSEFFDGY